MRSSRWCRSQVSPRRTAGISAVTATGESWFGIEAGVGARVARIAASAATTTIGATRRPSRRRSSGPAPMGAMCAPAMSTTSKVGLARQGHPVKVQPRSRVHTCRGSQRGCRNLLERGTASDVRTPRLVRATPSSARTSPAAGGLVGLHVSRRRGALWAGRRGAVTRASNPLAEGCLGDLPRRVVSAAPRATGTQMGTQCRGASLRDRGDERCEWRNSRSDRAGDAATARAPVSKGI